MPTSNESLKIIAENVSTELAQSVVIRERLKIAIEQVVTNSDTFSRDLNPHLTVLEVVRRTMAAIADLELEDYIKRNITEKDILFNMVN